MADRIELLEAALDSLSEGYAVFDLDHRVSFWNQAAANLTGYSAVQVMGRALPDSLQALLTPMRSGEQTENVLSGIVHLRHANEQDVAAMATMKILRDQLGRRMGMAINFHPTRGLDTIAHGESTDVEQLKQSQSELEEKLAGAFSAFERGTEKLGILWILVDQGDQVKQSHGSKAFEGMLDVLERVLALGLHPDEFIGRWGDSEFLIISHERNAEVLGSHAFTLTGLARTADFRWWGDRVSVSVSIGAAQAEEDETLGNLLERAKNAMQKSRQSGGNRVTNARGGSACLPS